jgi:hypothetical protein
MSSGSCSLQRVIFWNCTTSFKISLTIYQLTSSHNISEDFTVQQDNKPIHNSWTFQPSVSYFTMLLILEPIEHQESDWQVINRKVSVNDCGFIMVQPQCLVGLTSPATIAHVLAKHLTKHLPNTSSELPLYQPVFETKHFMISPTPSLDLILRPYLLQKCSVH